MEDVSTSKERSKGIFREIQKIVSKVHILDDTIVEVLLRALWIHSSFQTELYVNKTMTLEDALHCANSIIKKAVKHTYMVKHNLMKMLAKTIIGYLPRTLATCFLQ